MPDRGISNIRVIDLLEGHVRTLVGRGLFEFGNRDGSPEEELLQHPLAVAVDSQVLQGADSYNNKLESVAFGALEVRMGSGNGDPGILHEPGGIAAWDGRVLEAETNNPRLLRGTPATGEREEMTFRL